MLQVRKSDCHLRSEWGSASIARAVELALRRALGQQDTTSIHSIQYMIQGTIGSSRLGLGPRLIVNTPGRRDLTRGGSATHRNSEVLSRQPHMVCWPGRPYGGLSLPADTPTPRNSLMTQMTDTCITAKKLKT